MDDLTLFFTILTLGVGLIMLISVFYLSFILKASVRADAKKDAIYSVKRIICFSLAIYFALALFIFLILADLLPICQPY